PSFPKRWTVASRRLAHCSSPCLRPITGNQQLSRIHRILGLNLRPEESTLCDRPPKRLSQQKASLDEGRGSRCRGRMPPMTDDELKRLLEANAERIEKRFDGIDKRFDGI